MYIWAYVNAWERALWMSCFVIGWLSRNSGRAAQPVLDAVTLTDSVNTEQRDVAFQSIDSDRPRPACLLALAAIPASLAPKQLINLPHAPTNKAAGETSSSTSRKPIVVRSRATEERLLPTLPFPSTRNHYYQVMVAGGSGGGEAARGVLEEVALVGLYVLGLVAAGSLVVV